ncbi:MAG: flippase-like domain-containing protein [Muribaculaceae bacterium]|nr:flippase-like domain-containing protein [Muribaculaceae bacterium]
MTESKPQTRSGIILKIILPVLIGLGVVVWLFYKEFNVEALAQISFTPYAWFCLFLALVAVFMRDFGMAWRFRILTDHDLRWSRAANVTMLCEFTSAITPTSVGGSALSMIFLNREGINIGRATTLTMTTLFLDELFFVISIPIVFLIVPYSDLFGFGSREFLDGIKIVFGIVYAVIAAWTAILFFGIIAKPKAIRHLLIRLFSLKLLRRWLPAVTELADNMVTTARGLRSRNFTWWLKGFGSTAFSWIGRYLVVNALFLGFVPGASQLTVFARQFVVWALLMFSPTPGGSGLSEWLFKEYYGDLISGAGVVFILAILWRLLSYYIYLVIGIFLIPSFLNNKKSIKNND